MNGLGRIFALFRRDLRVAARDFMLVFMVVAPFLMALVLRFFIPGVSESALRLAVDGSVDADTAAAMERYAVVTACDGADALAARVAAADDVIGVTRDGDGYALLVEGNETEGLAELTVRVLDEISAGHASSLRVTWSDIADRRSPLALYGLAGVLLMAANMGGMMIGLAIIEEKEEFTLSAVNVTPITRGQYLAGKCMIGVAVPLVQMLALPFVMGVTGVHYGQLAYMTIAALSTSVVLGITIGLVSPTQIAGIAYIKFLFLAVGASFVGALVIPEGYQVFLYWSPFYWSVRGYVDVIWGGAGWGGVALKGLWTLLLSGALLAALSGYIRRGLSAIGGGT